MLHTMRSIALSRRRFVGASTASALLLALGNQRLAAARQDVEPADLGTLRVVVGGLDTRTPDQPENTDVLMIAQVDVPGQTVRAVSIPRDLYVEIPGFGYDKITRAYDYGSKAAGGEFKAGAQTVRDTVAANFGVETDGVVFTTFFGFIEVIDALGGVNLVNPYELYDAEYPTFDYGYKEIYYPAGEIHLSGEEALEFARTRHQDGDDGRVMRQQLVIRALLERARDSDVAAQLPELIVEHRSAIRTDLGRSKQLALALAAPGFVNDGVAFGTITPYLWPGTDPFGGWIYQGDWTQLPGLVQGFLDGTVGL